MNSEKKVSEGPNQILSSPTHNNSIKSALE